MIQLDVIFSSLCSILFTVPGSFSEISRLKTPNKESKTIVSQLQKLKSIEACSSSYLNIHFSFEFSFSLSRLSVFVHSHTRSSTTKQSIHASLHRIIEMRPRPATLRHVRKRGHEGLECEMNDLNWFEFSLRNACLPCLVKNRPGRKRRMVDGASSREWEGVDERERIGEEVGRKNTGL